MPDKHAQVSVRIIAWGPVGGHMTANRLGKVASDVLQSFFSEHLKDPMLFMHPLRLTILLAEAMAVISAPLAYSQQ